MDNIFTIKDRILYFIESQSIKKVDFFNKTGISASNFKGGGMKSEIGSDKLVKILSEYPIVSPDWLLTGNGPMLKKVEEAIVAIKITEPGEGVPLYNNEVAAGAGNFEDMLKEENLIGRYIIPGFRHADFMMYVKGNSMYPKYSNRDIIACKRIVDSHFIQWNKPHVIATPEQGLLVKRLRKSNQANSIMAVSDNRSYPPFDIPKVEILGLAIVIGVIRLE